MRFDYTPGAYVDSLWFFSRPTRVGATVNTVHLFTKCESSAMKTEIL